MTDKRQTGFALLTDDKRKEAARQGGLKHSREWMREIGKRAAASTNVKRKAKRRLLLIRQRVEARQCSAS